MHRSNKFCPVSDACPAVCCDFDGAGSKILPFYALKYVIHTNEFLLQKMIPCHGSHFWYFFKKVQKERLQNEY